VLRFQASKPLATAATLIGLGDVPCAARGSTVRAEPFEAIELAVGALFGDE
jgi:hypothetical protein